MRRVTIKLGEEIGPRWIWAAIRDKVTGEEARFEVAIPPVSEYDEGAARFRIVSDNPDIRGWHQHIVANWFRGWEGVLDVDGAPIPCTPENRLAVLEGDRWVRNFLINKIVSGARLVPEGNEGSGSV